jgi:hypothetical protein
MKITNPEGMAGRHGRPLMPVRDQPGLSRFNEQPRILRESPVTPTKRRSQLQSIALALLVVLAISAGLVRGPTDEEVFAQAVRDVAFGDSTILHPAAVVHADPRLQVPNVIESKLRVIPHQITPKKGPRIF